MLTLREGFKVLVSLSPVDMRKSIDGLCALVVDELRQDIQSSQLFVFYNRNRDKLKLIYWDKNGFALHYKRLERGKFKLSPSVDKKSLEISGNQLQWLLAGLDFQLMAEFSELNYSDYY